MALSSSVGEFHFTVAVAPTPTLDLSQEMHLLKAGLLYADRCLLCSLKTGLVLHTLGIGSLGDMQKLDFLEEIVPLLDPEDTAALDGIGMMRSVLKAKHHPMKALFTLQLRKAWRGIKDKVKQIAEQAGMGGILEAVESGLVAIHRFQNWEDTDALVGEYFAVISGAIADGHTYPLFDDRTGELIEAAVRDGAVCVQAPGARRSAEAGMAAGLLELLPMFEEASVDQVLDIRRELERPLLRFRSAIMGFADQMQSAQWEEGFSQGVTRAFHRDVRPAVLDIEEEVRSNKYLSELTKKLVDRPFVIPASASLSLVIDKLAALPDRASQALATSIPPAVGAAGLAYSAWREYQDMRSRTERQQLYFYYRAGTRLAK